MRLIKIWEWGSLTIGFVGAIYAIYALIFTSSVKEPFTELPRFLYGFTLFYFGFLAWGLLLGYTRDREASEGDH